MSSMVTYCNQNASMKDMNRGSSIRALFLYPKTKWCGPGNIAESDDDLGEDFLTDSCCRAHDNCFDFIEGFQTNHKLYNPVPYTR